MRVAIRRLVVLLLVLGLAAVATGKKKHEPLSSVSFLVVRDEDGKPIRNAAVVLHPVDDHGKQERGGLELKTDPEGKASYDGVPYGKLRIQVLAPRFQTYGNDYDVSQPSMDITIKMKRPAGQYSIYEEHPGENKDQKPAEENKKPQ
jgi:hypothetical protein